MQPIKEQLEVIKHAVSTGNKQFILSTINGIHPIILIYYQMNNPTFSEFNEKLSDTYINENIDDIIQMLITINDASLVNYIILEYNYHKTKKSFLNNNNLKYEEGNYIIGKLMEHFIDNNDIDNNRINLELKFSLVSNPNLGESVTINVNNN